MSFHSRMTLVAVVLISSMASQLRSAEPETTKNGFPIHQTAPKGQEEIYQRIEKKFGFIPMLTKVMAESPSLLNAYNSVQTSIRDHSTLAPEEINMVQLIVSVENKCHYCVPGHCMLAKMMYKTPESDIEAITNQKPLADAKHKALQSLTVALIDKRGHISKEEMKAFLDAGYTRAQALDVVACVAAKVMTNYTNALADTDLDDQFKPQGKK